MTDVQEGIGARGLKTKLIVNYLPQTMTDEEFKSLFSEIGELESANIMRDNACNYSFGFGFIDYATPLDAETAINKINGYKLLNKTLRVAYSMPPGALKNISLYVSGLTADTDEKTLEELFKPYGEVVRTRILRNGDGTSRLVGFVLFKQKAHAEHAIRVLQGHADGYGMNLQIKYAKASMDQHRTHPKFQEFIQQKVIQQNQQLFNNNGMSNGMDFQQIPPTQMGYQDTYGGGYTTPDYRAGIDGGQKAMRGRDMSARYNPTARPHGGGMSGAMGMGMGVGGGMQDNATILFCYNIGEEATERDMYALFSKHGRITKVDIVEGKGFGFVHMPIPCEANEAMDALNGFSYNGRRLQVSIKMKKAQS